MFLKIIATHIVSSACFKIFTTSYHQLILALSVNFTLYKNIMTHTLKELHPPHPLFISICILLYSHFSKPIKCALNLNSSKPNRLSFWNAATNKQVIASEGLHPKYLSASIRHRFLFYKSIKINVL